MANDGRLMAGICGLYCGTCPNYLAARQGDLEQLKTIAAANSMNVADVGCDGCLSDRVMPFCVECKNGFRRCAEDKGVTWCFECTEFPCERLRNFTKMHIVDGMPHHACVIDDLRYMKEHGVDSWLEVQDRAGRCPECGKRLYWFVRECPGCHARIR